MNCFMNLQPSARLLGLFLMLAILPSCDTLSQPIGGDDGGRHVQALLAQDDGVAVATPLVLSWNARNYGGVMRDLFLGPNGDPRNGAAILTENTIIIVEWVGQASPRGRYFVRARIPLRAVVDVRYTGRSPRLVEIETTEPAHLRIGAPEQTGLFWLTAGGPLAASMVGPHNAFMQNEAPTRALYEQIVSHIRNARRDWQPAQAPLPVAAVQP